MHFHVAPLVHKIKPKTWIIAGIISLSAGLILLAGTFLPLLFSTLRYYLFPAKPDVQVITKDVGKRDPEKKYIEVRDTEFGIVIPKIHANASIVANVDPLSANVYQAALTKGVAQAAGTAVPSDPGTMFLFAHSAGDISQARQYNAVFYLIDKLEFGDDIYIYHHGEKYRYQVTNSEVVDPGEVKYLQNDGQDRKLILMTCTPAGTTRDRFLVHAQMVPNNQ